MKITALRTRVLRVPLSRPYAISGGSWDSAEFVLCELHDDRGHVGHGQAAPAQEVTGESLEGCAAQLDPASLQWLVGRDPREIERLMLESSERQLGPGARAALDMALFDVCARAQGRALVEQLGRVHASLATSITIGVKSLAETLEEAREYLGRGFRILKVKIGVDVEHDLERLAKLREAHGAAICLRADANQGYDERSLLRFVQRMDEFDIELLEQPLPASEDAVLLTLSQTRRRQLVADESVHDARDLERLIGAGCPFGVINVKLMKCGGIAEALRMAAIADRAGLTLMFGCMDESVLGISAALHAAYACAATRYLDLDGSLDLAADPFLGGFSLAADRLDTLARPGLGAEPA